MTHFQVLSKGERKRINTGKTLQGILLVSAKQDMSRKLILSSNSDFFKRGLGAARSPPNSTSKRPKKDFE